MTQQAQQNLDYKTLIKELQDQEMPITDKELEISERFRSEREPQVKSK